MARVQIIGGGYVGLTSAAGFRELSHEVEIVELDDERRGLISQGKIPFYEPGLETVLKPALEEGTVTVSSPSEAAYEQANFVFLCLPTPQQQDGTADLSSLFEAASSAVPRMTPGSVLVSKSTVPVGTGRELASLASPYSVSVASNPEFLQEGNALSAFLYSERVVIGSDEIEVAERVATLYASLDTELVLTSLESAELAKHACNAFLATKLSFVNSIARLCELTGADILEVTHVMGTDSRIGARFLTPGPGWGGSCFPKDSSSLLHDARRAGYEFQLLAAAVAANEESFNRVVEKVAAACGGTLERKKIAAWGLAFKAGTDDVRHSPALAVIERLQAAGALVTAFDPMVEALGAVEVGTDQYSVCAGADVLVVLTEWPEFARSDLDKVAEQLSSRVIVDTRDVINTERAATLGFRLVRLGRRTIEEDGADLGIDTLVGTSQGIATC